MSKFNRIEFLLSWWSVFTLIVLGFIPIAWEVGSRYEGEYFPVVVRTLDPEDEEGLRRLPIIVAEHPSTTDKAYVDIFVQFDKVRNCDFLEDETHIDGRIVRLNRSMSWYDGIGQRLRIDFEPEDINLPITRPLGEQVAGPWRVHGTWTVEDTVAIVAHRCHPLWLTYTRFHPRSQYD